MLKGVKILNTNFYLLCHWLIIETKTKMLIAYKTKAYDYVNEVLWGTMVCVDLQETNLDDEICSGKTTTMTVLLQSQTRKNIQRDPVQPQV